MTEMLPSLRTPYPHKTATVIEYLQNRVRALPHDSEHGAALAKELHNLDSVTDHDAIAAIPLA